MSRCAPVNKKRALIVFAEDWGALPSSTQHLIKRVAKTRSVIWVNSIGLRKPRLSIYDVKRALNKLCKFVFNAGLKRTRSEAENISFVNPLTIPAPSSRWGKKIASGLLSLQLRPHLNKLPIDPILWTSLPTVADLVDVLPTKATIYYCGDDFSGLNGVDHEEVVKHEEKLIEKSDLVLVASETLKKKIHQDNLHVLPHGVDFDLFSVPKEKASDFPIKKRPTVGFYGSISGWLDVDLIKYAVESLPGWNFVFIGRSEIDTSAIDGYENVYFLGPRQHCDLPKYSQHWDVAILPFLNNKQIASCNPLKLMEYLAAGKPIVSTRFPAVKQYEGMVQGVDSPEAFVTAIKMSRYLRFLPAFPVALKSLCREETWDHRADSLNTMLSYYD